jgi:hypothetical protein
VRYFQELDEVLDAWKNSLFFCSTRLKLLKDHAARLEAMNSLCMEHELLAAVTQKLTVGGIISREEEIGETGCSICMSLISLGRKQFF